MLLQLWHPGCGILTGNLQLHEARDTLASTVANRRAQRSALWQDSSLFQDSFFAPDNRFDSLGNSEFASLSASTAGRAARNGVEPPDMAANGRNGSHRHVGAPADADADDIAAVVVDEAPRRIWRSSHH